jgi:hypothetical protein
LGVLRDGAKPSRRAGRNPRRVDLLVLLLDEKTAEGGTLYAKGRLIVDNPLSADATLCTATPSSALTTTFELYTANCTTSAPITIDAGATFDLWVGTAVTQGSSSVSVHLGVEGTLGGQYDSTITAPLPPAPTLASITPPSGAAGDPYR